MLTSTAPTLATANWVTTHSGTFIDQMPTCSPRATPLAISPDAARSTRRSKSLHDHRSSNPGKARASPSGWRDAVILKALPTV